MLLYLSVFSPASRLMEWLLPVSRSIQVRKDVTPLAFLDLELQKCLSGLAFHVWAVIADTWFFTLVQTSPGSVADVLWAAAVLDANAPAALSKLRELAATVDASQLNAETLQQIFQAHMALDRSVAGSVVQNAPLLPSQMLEQAKAAWQERSPSSAEPKVHLVDRHMFQVCYWVV